MIGQHSLRWCRLAWAGWIGLAVGCGSTPPVVETPPPPVSVSQPVVREVVDYDDYEGRIASVEYVEVRARVRGHLAKVNFQDGQMVNKGDLLFEVDPRQYKAALDAAEAQKAAVEASLQLATTEAERFKRLAAKGAVAQEELDVWLAKEAVAKSERLKAMASLEQAQLDLDFTSVTSPIRGKTGRAQVTEGNLINAGGGETLLTTITSVEPIYVYFDVDERAILRYRTSFGERAGKDIADLTVIDLKIPISVGVEGETGYPHQGMIDFLDNRVNPNTGTIQVRGVLPNAKRSLDPGMRARVRVPVSDPHPSLMITERAIGTDQGRKFVYVTNDNDVVERRDVKLDRLTDGLQAIESGIKPEDWVIVNGIQRVRDGAKVDPKKVAMPDAPAEAASQQPTSPKSASPESTSPEAAEPEAASPESNS